MKKSTQDIRREQIVELLSHRKFMTVLELSDEVNYSEATIKRDLNKLSRDGLIRRTRGGAVIIDERRIELPYIMKIKDKSDKHKHTMAKKGEVLLRDDLTLFMDSSSTVLYLAEAIKKFNNLKIITNGLAIASYLCEQSSASVNIIGGSITPKRFTINGSKAFRDALSYNVDISFLSCRGFDFETGATEVSEDEALMKYAYQKKSQKIALMVSSHKIGKIYTHKSLSVNEIDYFITDAILTKNQIEYLEKNHITVL